MTCQYLHIYLVLGIVCLIVGVGAIGTRLAAVAAGLGMRVLGLTRRPETLPPGVEAASKEQLFAQADVIVLCCPLNEQTRGLVDAPTLAAMKPDALLINVSRGAVIDTASVLQALRLGRLGGAALDVHDRQPLTGQEPVFDAPNLLLTPHVAGITGTSLHAMSRGAVDTLLVNITVAQPLAYEYAELFRGLGDDDVIALADSFALANCDRRVPLADRLRADLADGPS